MLKAVKKIFNFSRRCKHQKNLHVKSANVYFFLIPSSVFLLLETDKFSPIARNETWPESRLIKIS